MLILTEWDEFLAYDYDEIKMWMGKSEGPKTIYDFRQLMAKESLVEGPFDRAF